MEPVQFQNKLTLNLSPYPCWPHNSGVRWKEYDNDTSESISDGGWMHFWHRMGSTLNYYFAINFLSSCLLYILQVSGLQFPLHQYNSHCQHCTIKLIQLDISNYEYNPWKMLQHQLIHQIACKQGLLNVKWIAYFQNKLELMFWQHYFLSEITNGFLFLMPTPRSQETSYS